MTNLSEMSHYLKIEFIYLEEGIFITQRITQLRCWSSLKFPITIQVSHQ